MAFLGEDGKMSRFADFGRAAQWLIEKATDGNGESEHRQQDRQARRQQPRLVRRGSARSGRFAAF